MLLNFDLLNFDMKHKGNKPIMLTIFFESTQSPPMHDAQILIIKLYSFQKGVTTIFFKNQKSNKKSLRDWKKRIYIVYLFWKGKKEYYMKKLKLFLIPALVLSLGLVACNENQDDTGSNGGSSGSGTLVEVAHYDLSGISGSYDDSLPDRGIDLKGDITSLFVNQTSGSSLSLTSVTASDTGVEKAQVSQGHKVPGLKLNGKNNGSITLAFAASTSIDKIELGLYSWSRNGGDEEDFNLSLNDGEATLYTGSTEMIVLELEVEDLNSIKFSSPLNGLTNSRPIFSYIKLFETK